MRASVASPSCHEQTLLVRARKKQREAASHTHAAVARVAALGRNDHVRKQRPLDAEYRKICDGVVTTMHGVPSATTRSTELRERFFVRRAKAQETPTTGSWDVQWITLMSGLLLTVQVKQKKEDSCR